MLGDIVYQLQKTEKKSTKELKNSTFYIWLTK